MRRTQYHTPWAFIDTCGLFSYFLYFQPRSRFVLKDVSLQISGESRYLEAGNIKTVSSMFRHKL